VKGRVRACRAVREECGGCVLGVLNSGAGADIRSVSFARPPRNPSSYQDIQRDDFGIAAPDQLRGRRAVPPGRQDVVVISTLSLT